MLEERERFRILLSLSPPLSLSLSLSYMFLSKKIIRRLKFFTWIFYIFILYFMLNRYCCIFINIVSLKIEFQRLAINLAEIVDSLDNIVYRYT